MVTKMEINERVKKYRESLRKAGLRPVQIWVPDTRRPGFTEECRRQCRLAAEADRDDVAIQKLMDESLTDIAGWTD